MRSVRLYTLVALAAAMCCLPVYAQQYEGNAAAKAALDQGQKAESSGNYVAAEADFEKAISLDPDFAKAHEKYIFVSNLALAMSEFSLRNGGKTPTPEQTREFKKQQEFKKKQDEQQQELVKKYTDLAEQHPHKAVYPWALGLLSIEVNPSRTEKYCQQSIQIDGKFAQGYNCLALVADLRGDEKQGIAYARKAMDLEPDNADAAMYYADMAMNDPGAYKATVMSVLKRFPNSPTAAEELYIYGVKQNSDAAKIQAFEQLRRQFPPAKSNTSNQGVVLLFGIYDRTDPAKAQALAHEMLKDLPKDKNWAAYVAYADAMAKADREIQEKNPTAALATLLTIKKPGYAIDMRRKDLLQARALDAAGKTSKAYSNLLKIYAVHPTDKVRSALNEYGTKMGKSTQEIDGTIWSAMQANSKPAIPFDLPNFTDGKKVSLASYKGHVVIVDFWYPACGPCRASFPYLQQIAVKYKDRGVVVLAINSVQSQQSLVMPLLKSLGYDFIPLKGTDEWVSDVYHVHGFPSTFLIGADGRVYFRPFVYDNAQKRSAELGIDELLAHKG